MSHARTAARLLLGLVFVVFGLDGILHVFPLPPMPEAAARVIGTLVAYRLFYAVKAIEILSGALLLANRRVTLALCLLAPVVFNIVWFDAFLDPSSLPVAVGVSALLGFLLWPRREALAAVLA